jgi:rhamnogalacturonyl hydrolase YesR
MFHLWISRETGTLMDSKCNVGFRCLFQVIELTNDQAILKMLIKWLGIKVTAKPFVINAGINFVATLSMFSLKIL